VRSNGITGAYRAVGPLGADIRASSAPVSNKLSLGRYESVVKWHLDRSIRCYSTHCWKTTLRTTCEANGRIHALPAYNNSAGSSERWKEGRKDARKHRLQLYKYGSTSKFTRMPLFASPPTVAVATSPSVSASRLHTLVIFCFRYPSSPVFYTTSANNNDNNFKNNNMYV